VLGNRAPPHHKQQAAHRHLKLSYCASAHRYHGGAVLQVMYSWRAVVAHVYSKTFDIFSSVMGSRDKHSSKRSRDDERSRERGSKRRSHSGSKQPNPSSQKHKRRSDVEFEMTRTAARAVRDIIRYNDGLKGEIRQLAIALDDGNALDISDIKDEYLHSKVKLLFENLPQLRKKSSGSYVCRSRSSTSVMSFVAPMLEQDVSLPEATPKAFQPTAPEVSNPSRPQTGDPLGASSPEVPPNPAIPRPVMGPAAPPPHVLEAAAVLKEQIEMEDGDAEEKKGEADEEQGGSELIGPPPPQLEEEVDVGERCNSFIMIELFTFILLLYVIIDNLCMVFCLQLRRIKELGRYCALWMCYKTTTVQRAKARRGKDVHSLARLTLMKYWE
jgi:hypothetical protein